VFRLIRESANPLFDVESSQLQQAGSIASGDEFRKGGSRSDRGSAAADFEAGLRDSSVFNSRGEPKEIAANGIRNLDCNGRGSQFTYVARISEVLDQLRRHKRYFVAPPTISLPCTAGGLAAGVLN